MSFEQARSTACRATVPVCSLLAVCGTRHKESYFDIVMVGIVGARRLGGPKVRSGRKLRKAAGPSDVRQRLLRTGLVVAWGGEGDHLSYAPHLCIVASCPIHRPTSRAY